MDEGAWETCSGLDEETWRAWSGPRRGQWRAWNGVGNDGGVEGVWMAWTMAHGRHGGRGVGDQDMEGVARTTKMWSS